MPHQFGLLQLPAPGQGENEALTDPLLDVLIGFFSAILRSKLTKAWESRAEGEPLIRVAHARKPQSGDFKADDLPALYVFRTQDVEERTGDERETAGSQIAIWWVYPPSSQFEFVTQTPFLNGFSKTIQLGVSRGYDPSWIHPDDVDSISARFWGSVVEVKGRFDIWRVSGAPRESEVRIESIDHRGKPMSIDYPALMCELTVQESLEFDPTEYNESPTKPYGTVPTAIEFQISEDGLDTPQHEIEPDP